MRGLISAAAADYDTMCSQVGPAGRRRLLSVSSIPAPRKIRVYTGQVLRIRRCYTKEIESRSTVQVVM